MVKTRRYGAMMHCRALGENFRHRKSRQTAAGEGQISARSWVIARLDRHEPCENGACYRNVLYDPQLAIDEASHRGRSV
jgi:hypothetical protein